MTDLVPEKKNRLWQPGQSGNPAGRPKGAKNKITLMKQALEGELRTQLAPDMADILAKAIMLAKEGSEPMIRLLLDKTLPSTKAQDDEEGGKERIQIMIGRLPERKEDVIINGDKVD
jgi:hypothetical protein